MRYFRGETKLAFPRVGELRPFPEVPGDATEGRIASQSVWLRPDGQVTHARSVGRSNAQNLESPRFSSLPGHLRNAGSTLGWPGSDPIGQHSDGGSRHHSGDSSWTEAGSSLRCAAGRGVAVAAAGSDERRRCVTLVGDAQWQRCL